MELVAEDIMKVEEYARYTYSVPQSGFSQWSNITIAMRAKRESRREAVLTYSVALIIKYSRSRARWFLDTRVSRVEWTFSDSFSARLISLAFQVIEDLPEAMKRTCYSPILIGTLITLFLERAFGEEGIRTLKMMDQAENLNQTVKTLHFVLVNELGPCGGEQYERLGEELDEEGDLLPLPPESKRVSYASGNETETTLLDNRNSLPSLCLSGPTGLDSDSNSRDIASLLFRDNPADGDFWEAKRDRKDGGLDKWTRPHGLEGDGDPSENDENGIYEFRGRIADQEEDARERLPRPSDQEDNPHGSDSDINSSEDEDEGIGIHELHGLNCDSHALVEEEEDPGEELPGEWNAAENSKSLHGSDSDGDSSEDEDEGNGICELRGLNCD
ncbi:hypothetical protein B0H14DRAFT_2939072 [Mycena olivaceomarginata]|nr:hypothetical protein B0H14DRAFT_2939072 [Mycena olivaceomarginata]